jgi:hypothetical protein
VGTLGKLESGAVIISIRKLKGLIMPLVFVEQIGSHLLAIARLQDTAIDVAGSGQAEDILAVTIGTIRIIAGRSYNADILKINAVFLVEVRAETAKSFNIVLGRQGGDG